MKQKIVYLTIDDCPSRDFANKIDFLISNNIKAILFCVGKKMEKYPEEIIYAIKKGFIIGNHSYSHPHFSIISIKRAEKEIEITDKIIKSLYKKAGVKRKIKVFRFPYGDRELGRGRKREIQAILKKLGYKQPKFKNINYPYFKKLLSKTRDVFWTYDISEHKLKNLEEVFKRIFKRSGNLNNLNSSDIVLIHDHLRTRKWFFKIMKKLMKRNIKFELPEIK